ncbi:hypothetical protein UFOVP71_268 [uncultured Caudovirales phage]|uniref:Uncharacterized protein n=1 Tax=uncultured Caudovirales phage TaxID=2100421 RepID=A0A6J5TDL2_9CAUD|nr:hypothetical protein UFOVP71_268 [uncultured Caudovirales phage]
MFEDYQIALITTLVVLSVVALGVAVYRRNKRIAEATFHREWQVTEAKARLAREKYRAERLNPVTRSTTQVQRVGNNSIGIQSRGNVVYNDTSDDLLTAMILQNALNSSSDVQAGTVQWNNTPTITEAPVETYSAPEPSYSSSRSDDSSSSSYSSSYSSSSSDSSYSSSYSDSSSSDSGSSSSD